MGLKQIQNVEIRRGERGGWDKDLHSLKNLSLALKQSKDPDYFESQFEFQEEGKRIVLILSADTVDAGYCILNWDPKYGYFRSHKIPEIQDLNVLPEYRKQGLATKLIRYCEELAADRGCETMGISFGLDPSFGAAQRLYVKMGYVPDGYGITYDRKTVAKGEYKPVDDQLCLMLVKDL